MPGRRVLTREQVEQAKAMYLEEGLGFEPIAKKLNCAAMTISKELKEAGLVIRKPGRPRRPRVEAPSPVEEVTLPLTPTRNW